MATVALGGGAAGPASSTLKWARLAPPADKARLGWDDVQRAPSDERRATADERRPPGVGRRLEMIF